MFDRDTPQDGVALRGRGRDVRVQLVLSRCLTPLVTKGSVGLHCSSEATMSELMVERLWLLAQTYWPYFAGPAAAIGALTL